MSWIYFLLWIATSRFLCSLGAASFPDNSVPISVTTAQDVPYSVFTGGDATFDILRYTQDLKMVTIAGREYYAVTGREKIFLVRPDNFSPDADRKIPYSQVYTWKSDQKAKNLCVMKGQSKENCENYIRVLEQMDGNGNKLLVCATNSYNPRCLYITASLKENNLILDADEETFSGTEKCAFGPDQTGVNLYTGKSLYSATVSEFSGRSYAVARSLGDEKQLRTPKFDSKYLNEPYFVKMVNDGERVLIFMNEMVRTDKGDIRMVAYVAQVCKNDVGGQHVLVRQWTKFEKTRLNCSLNGFYFDQLQDVSEPVDVRTTPDSDSTVKTIYATFTTPDYSVPGSAVCAFTMDWIHDALLGRFREERGKGGQKSGAPSGDRHPGNCPSDPYTESELLFLKSHPLLEDQARGALLTTHVGERWTSIAVDPTAGPQKNWTVYFVGTTNGHMLRYLAPTGGSKNAVLLRRQEVYDAQNCSSNSTETEEKSVTRIVVDSKRGHILVTFKHCVVSIPLRSCAVHKCKRSCFASADPYCGWNGTECISYTAPSVNVEQYVFSEAMQPSSNIKSLCPQDETHEIYKNDEKVLETTTSNKEGGDSNKQHGRDSRNDYNATNGTFVETRIGDGGGVYSQPQGSEGVVTLELYKAILILAATAIVSFSISLCIWKFCCGKKGAEKQLDGMEMSKTSMANTESLCKKFIASISPHRRRKPSLKTPASLNHSQLTISDQQGEPLVTKDNNKLDEFVKHQNQLNESHTNEKLLRRPESHRGSRLNSTSSASQVTECSMVSYNSNRRNSSQHTSSMSSMSAKGGRQHFQTAPRARHYSGNRTSDPSDYSNAPTLRADKVNSRGQSRHSTPVSQIPITPTSKELSFQFEQVIEKTDHVLGGVQEVIEQQERRQEMAPVMEEYDEIRGRHNSSDSGKGSSPRNSMQTEDQDKVATLNRPRPDDLQLNATRGRKRLNSEPTSPTVSQPPLPPPSSHKPVGRSTSMRAQHALSVPSYYPRQRSESFSHQSQPSTPTGKASPPRMQQMVQSGFQPQAQPNIYATLPTNPKSLNNGHPQIEKYNRQQSYDTYSPHNRYPPIYDQREVQNHPAMAMPDRYSSLPLRSQAHRSNKKPFPTQYVPHPAQMSRRNSAASQVPPPYRQQMSSPANFDQQRSAQRPRYVPTPTVPGYPATVPEQDAV